MDYGEPRRTKERAVDPLLVPTRYSPWPCRLDMLTDLHNPLDGRAPQQATPWRSIDAAPPHGDCAARHTLPAALPPHYGFTPYSARASELSQIFCVTH